MGDNQRLSKVELCYALLGGVRQQRAFRSSKDVDSEHLDLKQLPFDFSYFVYFCMTFDLFHSLILLAFETFPIRKSDLTWLARSFAGTNVSAAPWR